MTPHTMPFESDWDPHWDRAPITHRSWSNKFRPITPNERTTFHQICERWRRRLGPRILNRIQAWVDDTRHEQMKQASKDAIVKDIVRYSYFLHVCSTSTDFDNPLDRDSGPEHMTSIHEYKDWNSARARHPIFFDVEFADRSIEFSVLANRCIAKQSNDVFPVGRFPGHRVTIDEHTDYPSSGTVDEQVAYWQKNLIVSL
jgi:hypothetical protein